VVLPARVRKPRDKAGVEAGVQVAQRWVLAPLRNRRFFSLEELHEAIAERVAAVNARPFRGQPTGRAELFAEFERPVLRPLPARRYELATWKKATAGVDYHVELDRRFYSVPYSLVRQRLDVRATTSTVEVFRAGRRVASHAREYGARRYVTDPAHMPASHRAHAEWTPSRLVEWAATVSPATAGFVEALMAARPHPEHAYRACLGLMSLARRYGPERLSAACERASTAGALSYTSVKSILAEGLDRVPLPAPAVLPAPPVHENLRGRDYWTAENPETPENPESAESASGGAGAGSAVTAGSGAGGGQG
jgi:transposase